MPRRKYKFYDYVKVWYVDVEQDTRPHEHISVDHMVQSVNSLTDLAGDE